VHLEPAPRENDVTTTFEKLTRGMYEDSENGEAFRSFADEAASTGRSFIGAANAATLDALKTAVQLQNDAIASGLVSVDASFKAGKALTATWTEVFRQGQSAATKLAEAGAKVVAGTLEAQK
jgi:hypothetical protein